MAGERSPQEITFPAAGDLSASQFRAVYMNASGSADVLANSGTPALGILTNKPGAATRGARVCVGGVTKMEAGVAVSEGDLIVAVAGGRGSPVLAGTAAGTHHVIGMAVSSAGASADLFEILVRPDKYTQA